VAVLTRGSGTSLAGQGCNSAVVIDCSKNLHRILEVDPERRLARVEAGVVLDTLRQAAEAHHLTFGPDPASHSCCTFGGMIGNNSCGAHSIMAGKTDANVEEMEVLTYDGLRLRVGATSEAEIERIASSGGRRGDIYSRLRDLRDRYAQLVRERYPRIPRRVSGYNLDFLLPEQGFNVARALVGSEGTCVTVLEATIRLINSPPHRAMLAVGYPDLIQAAEAVPEILASGCIGLEGFDQVMVDSMQQSHLHLADLTLLPAGSGWLLVEFGGDTPKEAVGRARSLAKQLAGPGATAPTVRLVTEPSQQRRLWAVREAGLPATARVPGELPTWEGWEDAAVPPESLGGYLRDLRAMAARFGYRCPMYGHFGDGCVHNRLTFDFGTPAGVARYRSFVEEAADLVVSYGGSLSGEHGDGQSRGELLQRMFGPELMTAFREFRAIWDPGGRMNPGKLVDALPLDANLRLGPDYRPLELTTRFRFPADQASLAAAAERCVGVAKCRSLSEGVMCPSFRATREERHSTRGRARLLSEMFRADPLTHGWRERAVHESLDLCLSCKGCRSDCPVHVDVAAYKAEFLHHYYSGRVRPRIAYAAGALPWLAAAGSRTPWLANALGSAPGLSTVAKAAAGVAGQRALPHLAPTPFTSWFARRPLRNDGATEVVLWPDTFTNRFSPGIAAAAVRVLEAAGFRVTVPSQWVCCGRPLYDRGMLGLAERLLRRSLRALGPAIAAGTPVVVLEPSCAAVFRDELPNLLAGEDRAEWLSQNTFTLAEFLARAPGRLDLRRCERRALVQTHCHQRAVIGFDADRQLMDRLGLRYEVLDAGCCGMAGAFGFERGEKYQLSMRIGELGVLPAVRAASGNTMILADGFSCREQIVQGAGRPALHLAQVVDQSLSNGPSLGA
jgi:FAD/FMN-containing dehydrogenase/Fe-S oxidoreductase